MSYDLHSEFPWIRRTLINRSFDYGLEGCRCMVYRGRL